MFGLRQQTVEDYPTVEKCSVGYIDNSKLGEKKRGVFSLTNWQARDA